MQQLTQMGYLPQILSPVLTLPFGFNILPEKRYKLAWH